MTTEDRARAIAWFEKQAKCLAMPGAAKMFGLAVEALNAGRWVAVSERLPEVPLFEQADDDWVSDRGYPFLVTYDDGTIDIESFWSKTGFSDCDSSVTHWMPLPTPPRKDDEAWHLTRL